MNEDRIKALRKKIGLSDEKIVLIVEIQTMSEEVDTLLDKLGETEGVDRRLVDAGKLRLQAGLMSLIRAIF